MRVLYFAYGSNMSSERLRSRISFMQIISRALLKDWKVVFNKRSNDGSGKANLVESPGAVTWGVLYEIDVQDLDTLDKIEAGYEHTTVRIWTPDGNVVEAVTYISENLTDDPRAYKWYKELILSGARENNLPQDYIAYLEELPVKPNSDSETAG